MSQEISRIAVFGDTHGHLRLMFQLSRLWQMENGLRLDGILQCGDFGFYPDPWCLDKATLQYSRRDPEELGFTYFAEGLHARTCPLVERILCGPGDTLETVTCPVIWCHGNHEDFQHLAPLVAGRDLAAVDRYRRLFWLRSGVVTDHAGVRLAALGGGPEALDAPADDFNLDEPLNRVGARAAEELAKRTFDLLLTHCGPRGGAGEAARFGSARIRQVIERCQPAFHFYAHHKNRIPPTTFGRTRSFWLNDVNFSAESKQMDRPLEPDCMGILSWGPATREFRLVEPDGWMKRVTYVKWLKL